jgi:hypothetical protein
VNRNSQSFDAANGGVQEEGHMSTKDVSSASAAYKEKAKKKVDVLLTTNLRVEGHAHLDKEERLLDMVNDEKLAFIPLTDVTATDGNTKQTLNADFVAVNKSAVLLIMVR